MPGPFEKDARELSADQYDRLLGGGAGRPTWARFARQPAHERRRAAPASAVSVAAGIVAPTLAMQATASRVRAANPSIFAARSQRDGDNTPGVIPDMPQPDPNSKVGFRDFVNISWLALTTILNPARAALGLAASVAYSTARKGELPSFQDAIKSTPVRLMELVERAAASSNDYQSVSVQPNTFNAPAPPSPSAVFSYDPRTGLLDGIFPGAPLPENVNAATGIDAGLADPFSNSNSNPYGNIDSENTTTTTSTPGGEPPSSTPGGDPSSDPGGGGSDGDGGDE